MASLPRQLGELHLVDDLDADGVAEVVVTNGGENGSVILYPLRSGRGAVDPSIARREKAR